MCARKDNDHQRKIKKKVNNKTREENMCEVRDNDQY